MKFIECRDPFYGINIHIPVSKIDAVATDPDTKAGSKIWLSGRIVPCSLSIQEVMKLISNEVKR
jgi:hypothetical protein